jgi:hypothetical protein
VEARAATTLAWRTALGAALCLVATACSNAGPTTRKACVVLVDRSSSTALSEIRTLYRDTISRVADYCGGPDGTLTVHFFASRPLTALTHTLRLSWSPVPDENDTTREDRLEFETRNFLDDVSVELGRDSGDVSTDILGALRLAEQDFGFVHKVSPASASAAHLSADDPGVLRYVIVLSDGMNTAEPHNFWKELRPDDPKSVGTAVSAVNGDGLATALPGRATVYFVGVGLGTAANRDPARATHDPKIVLLAEQFWQDYLGGSLKSYSQRLGDFP